MSLLFCSISAFANQNVQTSNHDLRNDKELLSIKHFQGVTSTIFKSFGDEYFYESIEDKSIDRYKISNIHAEQYDNFFVSQFIHLKYSMPTFSGKSCSKIYTLTMRGETQNICKQEKDKLTIMKQIIEKIKTFKK